MPVKFSIEDQIIARLLSRNLPPKQRKAIVLRFWYDYSIFEIAKSLRMSWEEADRTLKNALAKLKKDCMEQPRFSKAFKLPVVA